MLAVSISPVFNGAADVKVDMRGKRIFSPVEVGCSLLPTGVADTAGLGVGFVGAGVGVTCLLWRFEVAFGAVTFGTASAPGELACLYRREGCKDVGAGTSKSGSLDEELPFVCKEVAAGFASGLWDDCRFRLSLVVTGVAVGPTVPAAS